MNPFKPNLFSHAANLLLLVGYSLSDVLWLRLLAAVSSLIVIPYFVLQPVPMWTPIGWNAVLVAVNLFQSWRLFAERRAAKLTPQAADLRQSSTEKEASNGRGGRPFTLQRLIQAKHADLG